jgi:hypothetical protein
MNATFGKNQLINPNASNAKGETLDYLTQCEPMRGPFGLLSCTCVSILAFAQVHAYACACAYICMHRDAHVCVYAHACASVFLILSF